MIATTLRTWISFCVGTDPKPFDFQADIDIEIAYGEVQAVRLADEEQVWADILESADGDPVERKEAIRAAQKAAERAVEEGRAT